MPRPRRRRGRRGARPSGARPILSTERTGRSTSPAGRRRESPRAAGRRFAWDSSSSGGHPSTARRIRDFKSTFMPESISVFFPAYNDEASIGGLVAEALALLPSLTDDFEVIVVDDGSTDGTARVLDELAREDPRLRVVHHEVNRGYGGALRTGFASATKELVFYTDGDGQYDVRELG